MIRRSRPGLLVNGKCLQWLFPEETLCDFVNSDLVILVVKHSVTSHGGLFLMAPSLGQGSDDKVQFCKSNSKTGNLMCFLFSHFPSATLFPSSEAATLIGNTPDPEPSTLFLVVALNLFIIHQLGFLNKYRTL